MTLALIICANVVVVYTLYLQIRNKEHVQAWLTSLITSIVSVLLGVVTAVSMLNYQDSRNDEVKRKQLIDLVEVELNINAESLDHETLNVQIENKKWRFHSSFLPHQAIDTAALSGIFKGQQAKDLLTLGNNIYFYNTLVDSVVRLYTITPMTYRIAMAQNTYDNLEKAHSAMRVNLVRCRQSLGLPGKP